MELTTIHGQCDFVEALLENNVNPNLGTRREPPILLAARYGHHKILKLLSKSNAKLDQECQVRFDEHNARAVLINSLGS